MGIVNRGNSIKRILLSRDVNTGVVDVADSLAIYTPSDDWFLIDFVSAGPFGSFFANSPNDTLIINRARLVGLRGVVNRGGYIYDSNPFEFAMDSTAAPGNLVSILFDSFDNWVDVGAPLANPTLKTGISAKFGGLSIYTGSSKPAVIPASNLYFRIELDVSYNIWVSD